MGGGGTVGIQWSKNQGRSQDFRRGGAEGGGRDLPIGPNSVCFVESSIFTAFV